MWEPRGRSARSLGAGVTDSSRRYEEAERAPDSSGRGSDEPAAPPAAAAWIVGIVGLAMAGAIVLRLLIPADMDPTVFLAFGEDSTAQTEYARRFLDHVATRPEAGHDGKYFFVLANDPWLLHPDHNAVVLDRPAYRAERILYPMLASGFGSFPPAVVVWSLLITNIVCF